MGTPDQEVREFALEIAGKMRTTGTKVNAKILPCKRVARNGRLAEDEVFVLELVGYGRGKPPLDVLIVFDLKAAKIVDVAGETERPTTILDAQRGKQAVVEAGPAADRMQHMLVRSLVEHVDPTAWDEDRTYPEPRRISMEEALRPR